jgi:hypothetical protein
MRAPFESPRRALSNDMPGAVSNPWQRNLIRDTEFQINSRRISRRRSAAADHRFHRRQLFLAHNFNSSQNPNQLSNWQNKGTYMKLPLISIYSSCFFLWQFSFTPLILPHHSLAICAKFQSWPTPPIPTLSLSSPALHRHLHLKKSLVDHQFMNNTNNHFTITTADPL